MQREENLDPFSVFQDEVGNSFTLRFGERLWATIHSRAGFLGVYAMHGFWIFFAFWNENGKDEVKPKYQTLYRTRIARKLIFTARRQAEGCWES